MDKPKYDIGQELYIIVPDATEYEKCECCGHIKVKAKNFKVNDKPLIIESISIDKYGITFFHDFLGGHFTDDFAGNKNFFTTRQAAQDECDRRNREGRQNE